MTITEIANAYIGEKEKHNNRGFENPFLETKMKSKQIGWRRGWPWCAAIVKLWVIEYYQQGNALLTDEQKKYISSLSVGVLRSYQSLKKTFPALWSASPSPDTIVCWQHYNNGRPTMFGHTGICTSSSIVYDDGREVFRTIEGNTNAAGSRNGDRVAVKERTVSRVAPNNGLELLGFFHII